MTERRGCLIETSLCAHSRIARSLWDVRGFKGKKAPTFPSETWVKLKHAQRKSVGQIQQRNPCNDTTCNSQVMCDQIQRLLKGLDDKFSYKCSQQIWLFWKMSLFTKKCNGYFVGNCWINWATFYSKIWSLCSEDILLQAILVPFYYDYNNKMIFDVSKFV